MSLVELETEVRGAKELAARFAKAEKSFVPAVSPPMHDALLVLKQEQQRLVPQYERETMLSIATKMNVGPDTVEGRVGPGASPGMPPWAVVVEGGRSAGARVGPFGINSKLYQWVQFRTGGGVRDARFIAMAIARRGTPTKNNPRTPNPAPVFVERSWRNKFNDVHEILFSTGATYVKEVMKGWVNFGTP